MTASASAVRRRVFQHVVTGVTVGSIPVGTWWYWSVQQRKKRADQVSTAIRIPNVDDTYDFIISEKCQAGDVILFDRRWEYCASGPWAALSCVVSRYLLANSKDPRGQYDHAGLVVPGYVRHKADEFDPTNLLLMEATPQGMVARPLKERLERSQSRSVLLLQLACPGERRNDDTDPSQSVERTRNHVERELRKFRDTWAELSKQKHYGWMHSTLTIGGAIAHTLVPSYSWSGPISPATYLVLLGLHKAAAAQNITEKENLKVKARDFLEKGEDGIRLRPGWRFLAPVPLKENAR